MSEHTFMTPKQRRSNFNDASTLEYHPLFNSDGQIIAYYRLSDMVAFEDRLTRKHNWRLTPDLDHDTLTIALDHEDMTAGPSVTIPLYTITKERNAALNDFRIAYHKEQKDLETAEPQKDVITDSQPAGLQIDGRFDAFASNVYESLRPYHQKTHNHMLKIETAVSPFYFPVNQIRELVSILKPTRRNDHDPVFSFSLSVDVVTVNVCDGVKWDKESKPKVTLKIKTDGQVETITNLYGSLDNPMENRPNSASIVWSLPQVNPIPSDRLAAILNFISYCPPMETDTAPPALETAVPAPDDQWLRDLEFYAEKYGTLETAVPAPPALETAPPALETAVPAPETLETAVPALETAVPAPETLETAVPALETAPPALETAVPAVTRKNKRTGTRRRPDLLKMDVWSRLDYILSEDGIPADYLETLKSRKYKPVWA